MIALRAILRFAGSVLAVSGALLLADAGLTLAWQEPFSAYRATRDQAALDDQLTHEFAAVAQDLAARGDVGGRSTRRALRAAAARYQQRMRTGRGVGKISMPTLGRRYAMVHGTDTKALRKGPAHYPDTPLPGQGGTIGIAGHRTTYLAPFRSIDELRPGDTVALTMPYGRFTYSVTRTRIVRPDALWVKRRVGYEQIILTACHPLYSAAKRIVVFARLVRAQPPDALGSAAT